MENYVDATPESIHSDYLHILSQIRKHTEDETYSSNKDLNRRIALLQDRILSGGLELGRTYRLFRTAILLHRVAVICLSISLLIAVYFLD